MSRFLKLMVVFGAVFVARPVLASCEAVSLASAPPGESLHFGNITVDPALPVGGTIATVSTAAGGSNDCVWQTQKWSTRSPAGNGVYQTNLRGVGIRMTQDGAVITPGQETSKSSARAPLKIELVKTGAISGGTLENGIIAKQVTSTDAPVRTLKLSGVNALAAASCTVTTPDVNVNMGMHRVSEFDEYALSGWQKFSIGLNCVQGTIVSIQFDYATTPQRIGSTMPLDDASSSTTAKGIGVQLYFEDDTRTYPGVVVADYLTSVNGGVEYIRMKARYIKISDPVKVGNANATATFTMTYR